MDATLRNPCERLCCLRRVLRLISVIAASRLYQIGTAHLPLPLSSVSCSLGPTPGWLDWKQHAEQRICYFLPLHPLPCRASALSCLAADTTLPIMFALHVRVPERLTGRLNHVTPFLLTRTLSCSPSSQLWLPYASCCIVLEFGFHGPLRLLHQICLAVTLARLLSRFFLGSPNFTRACVTSLGFAAAPTTILLSLPGLAPSVARVSARCSSQAARCRVLAHLADSRRAIQGVDRLDLIGFRVCCCWLIGSTRSMWSSDPSGISTLRRRDDGPAEIPSAQESAEDESKKNSIRLCKLFSDDDVALISLCCDDLCRPFLSTIPRSPLNLLSLRCFGISAPVLLAF